MGAGEDIDRKVFVLGNGETGTEVKLSYSFYNRNGALAVTLMSRPESEEGLRLCDGECSFCEPHMTVTLNLPASSRLPFGWQFINEEECPWLGTWLEENGIASPRELGCRTERFTFRAYEFNLPRGFDGDLAGELAGLLFPEGGPGGRRR